VAPDNIIPVENGISPPLLPGGPIGPCGIVKLNTAFDASGPELVTKAGVPTPPVIVVPTVTVAGGIVKFNTAFVDVPLLVTAAGVPLVVVPTVTVAADPGGQEQPEGEKGDKGDNGENKASKEEIGICGP